MQDPMNLEQIKDQRQDIFAYKFADGPPKPEIKIFHGQEASEMIAFGLGKGTLTAMIPGTEAKSVAKMVLITYKHLPDMTFQIQAPHLVHELAPQILDFTVKSKKHGPLHYKLTYIADYVPPEVPA